MSSQLPSHPDLDWLRKEARRLLRKAQVGEKAALDRFRSIPQFKSLDDAALRERVALTDAQHAVARAYGFESWPKVRRAVEDRQPLAVQTGRFLAAIREEHPETARRLFARVPAIARTSVFAASAAGDAEFVSAALARDPVLAKARDDEGWNALLYAAASPLHATGEAARRGILQAAELLLAAGADPESHTLFNAEDPRSRATALYRACMSDHVSLVKLLLERGADPNDGESIYHAAERDFRACLELLLAHGTDLSGRHPHWNNTPLYFLAGYQPQHALKPRALRGMRWLLEHGADPNVTSYESQETPLHAMARNGHGPTVIEMLVAHGAGVNARRADGKTALVLALRAGATETAEALRAHGAETGGLGPADELVSACMWADEPAARMVLAAHPDLIERLADEDRQALANAAGADRVESIRLMARLGFGLDSEAVHSGTPLHHAAWNGRPASVRALIELGAPVDHRDREYGSSPVGWAAHGSRHCRDADPEYLEVVDALLDAGASRAASINRWGEPPEAMASRRVAAHLGKRGFVG